MVDVWQRNLAFVHWIDGDLDRPALTAAVAELHRRHEILRTRYPGGAKHSVSTLDDYRLPFADLSAGADPAGEVGRLLDESVNRPFDLAAEAPVRWMLHALGPGRHALTLVLHRSAFDAGTIEDLRQDCQRILEQVVGDRTTEQAVVALFAELLGHERIGVDDNFFALGGHSLLAARLVALVRKGFQVELTLLDLFDNPTVAGVVAFIEGDQGGTP